jgi:hypothetical protein
LIRDNSMSAERLRARSDAAVLISTGETASPIAPFAIEHFAPDGSDEEGRSQLLDWRSWAEATREQEVREVLCRSFSGDHWQPACLSNSMIGFYISRRGSDDAHRLDAIRRRSKTSCWSGVIGGERGWCQSAPKIGSDAFLVQLRLFCAD